jgi:hypothetical protein
MGVVQQTTEGTICDALLLRITDTGVNTKKHAAILSAVTSVAGIIASIITLNLLSFLDLVSWVSLFIPSALLLYSTLLAISAQYELEQFQPPRWVKPLALTTLIINSIIVLCDLAIVYWLISPYALGD